MHTSLYSLVVTSLTCDGAVMALQGVDSLPYALVPLRHLQVGTRGNLLQASRKPKPTASRCAVSSIAAAPVLLFFSLPLQLLPLLLLLLLLLLLQTLLQTLLLQPSHQAHHA